MFFAPWNPPHPDFSFPAAFSLIFHQMARTKVSISFGTSTTSSSSTLPPLSLIPISNLVFILVPRPLLCPTTLADSKPHHVLSTTSTYVKQTCHLPRPFRIRPLACHAMVVAPAVITCIAVVDGACLLSPLTMLILTLVW